MTLRKILLVLGAINASVLLARTVFSYVEAPAAHYATRSRSEIAFYDHAATQIAPAAAHVAALGGLGIGHEAELTHELTRELSGEGWVKDQWHFTALYSIPLVLSTCVALTLLAILGRKRDTIDATVPDLLLHWSYAFAVLLAFATPTLVEDFWLSIAWGRMLAIGVNPYYHMSAGAVAQLPMNSTETHMTYGPLWALIIWGVEAVTRGSVLWSAVAFKSLLLGAWIITLRLLYELMRNRSTWERCISIVMVGWLPIGVGQVVGDGHNDIVMIVLALLWLWLLEREHRLHGSVALALSVTVKYVTAPLFLLGMLHRTDGDEPTSMIRHVAAYIPRGLAALLVIGLVFAPVYRGHGFFADTAAVNVMQFYLPSDAVRAIATIFHLPIWRFVGLVQWIFPVVAVVTIANYVRSPSRDAFRVAVAGVMLSVLFNAAHHVWPWYVVWLLVVSATVPRSLIGRWATGVALTAPFPLIVWTAFPESSGFVKYQLPSLFAYGGALLWTVWLWRYFVPHDSAMGREVIPGPTAPPLLRDSAPWAERTPSRGR